MVGSVPLVDLLTPDNRHKYGILGSLFHAVVLGKGEKHLLYTD